MSDSFLTREIEKRKKYYSLDRARVRIRILRMGHMTGPMLRGFVEEAFDTAAQLEENTHFSADTRKELIDQLCSHLNLLLAGNFGEELELSYHLVLNSFAYHGKDTRLFLSIGAVVMRSILKAGAWRMMWRPFEFAKCGMAMGSLFSFDVAVALHLQLQQERAALANRSDMIGAEVADFRANVSNIVKSVETLTGQLAAASAAVDKATTDTATKSDTIAAAISNTTTAIHKSSQSIMDLDDTTDAIANQVSREELLAGEAVASSRQSGKAVAELAAALRDIDSIVELIGAIAAQTNLLALNATIESSRAGEAGRGFAVVANEIKALALRTEQATSEIRALLAKVQDAASGTNSRIDDVTGIIGRLSEATGLVADAVRQQRLAVAAIRTTMEKVTGNMTGIQSGIAELVESSIGSARQAGSLSGAVRDLQSGSENLTDAFESLAGKLKHE